MALRKLQAEIDRTLKAVATGVEVFESTFDKLNHASNATQKDKLENDLKTQIKKLQRMRDQIKAWLGSSDIKDKSALLDNRKLIETQMERFKALEKEMKMKAFSKEGLIAQSRLDPSEKAKRDMIDWIGNMTDDISRQVEQTEAEAEALQTTKKKKAAADRLGELDQLNERRQWHVGRLEVVQRMLENGQLSTEQVEAIQEDVKYFVEANTEEDFDFDQGIYDELNLQDEDEMMPDYAHGDDTSNLDSASLIDASDVPPSSAPKTPAKEEKEKKSTPAAKSSSAVADDQPPSPVSAKKQPSRKSTMDTTKQEMPKLPIKPFAEPVPPVPAAAPVAAPAASAPPPKPVALPPIRYAAAAAAAVAGSAPAAAPAAAPTAQSPVTEAVASPSEAKVEPAPVPEEALAESPAEAEPEIAAAPIPVPAASPAVAEPAQTNGHAPPPPPGIAASRSPAPAQPQASATFQSPAQPVNGLSPAPPSEAAPPPGYPVHAESSRSAQGFTSPRNQTGVLGNLMQSFDMAKELSERRSNDIGQLHAALDGSYANAPQQLDAEPPRYYHPKNPVKTPSYYPQARPPILEDKSIYQRFELDQLFFIFYYYSGTYEQWLAAQELKRHNWRFHKQYLTWFKRAHNPQAITEDYEQGGYFYFDWENSWCQRKKSDFRFEYRWLSDH
ncbi:General negative regulator of transcription subunit 3 [Saitozyma sp. JCM 24511]|nr:General negative regulator of transcription subunit 3 [Saitozyma sp. JCM 24511]